MINIIAALVIAQATIFPPTHSDPGGCMCEKTVGQCPCLAVPNDEDEKTMVVPFILEMSPEDLQKLFQHYIQEEQGTPLPVI